MIYDSIPESPGIHKILFQCWPNIETALGDCPVLAAMRVTLSYRRRQKGNYLDNTIHWLNADVMLGHHL